MSPLTVLGEFGWREALFMAAILLLLAGARGLGSPRHPAARDGGNGTRDAASRAYLDGLIGRAEAGMAAIPDDV